MLELQGGRTLHRRCWHDGVSLEPKKTRLERALKTMKHRSVDAQLFKDMKEQIYDLITYAEFMVAPSPGKEMFLDKAREVYKRAKQQNMEEG